MKLKTVVHIWHDLWFSRSMRFEHLVITRNCSPGSHPRWVRIVLCAGMKTHPSVLNVIRLNLVRGFKVMSKIFSTICIAIRRLRFNEPPSVLSISIKNQFVALPSPYLFSTHTIWSVRMAWRYVLLLAGLFLAWHELFALYPGGSILKASAFQCASLPSVACKANSLISPSFAFYGSSCFSIVIEIE